MRSAVVIAVLLFCVFAAVSSANPRKRVHQRRLQSFQFEELIAEFEENGVPMLKAEDFQLCNNQRTKCLPGTQALREKPQFLEEEGKTTNDNGEEEESTNSEEEEDEDEKRAEALLQSARIKIKAAGITYDGHPDDGTYEFGSVTKFLGKGAGKRTYEALFQDREVAAGLVMIEDIDDIAPFKREVLFQSATSKIKLGDVSCEEFIQKIVGVYIGPKKETDEKVTENWCMIVFTDIAQGDAEHLASSFEQETELQQLGRALEMVGMLKCVEAAGLVHRDIKPANMLLNFNNRLKLTDFGAAAKIDDTDELKNLAGTVCYVPSEYADESLQKFDVHSMGASWGACKIRKHFPLSKLIPEIVSDMSERDYNNRPTIKKVAERVADVVLKKMEQHVKLAVGNGTLTNAALGRFKKKSATRLKQLTFKAGDPSPLIQRLLNNNPKFD